MAAWYEKSSVLTAFIFRIWYRIVNNLDRKGELVFMNYGFCNGKPIAEIEEEHEGNRTCIQLYDQLVGNNDLSNQKVLEVGSGRGGGLAFLSQKHKPKMATGVDLDKTAVRFCNKKHGHAGLNFLLGNAQNLPLEDGSIDTIINVESSHRYDNMHAFLAEVKRVLRPGGSFFITDFRYQENMESFFQAIESCGLKIIAKSDITSHVVEALKKDDPRRRDLVKRLVPSFLKKHAFEFAGVIGSNTYNNFASGQWGYFNYHLTKD